jgi:hypothetical protein
LDNDMYAGIDCTSIEDDDCVAGEVADADHSNDTDNTDVDTPYDIGSGEASMDVADDNDGGGTDCDAAGSSDRGNANVEAADKSNTSAADVETIEESFNTMYSVFVPFQSHLVRSKNEGFETILEPVIKLEDDGSDFGSDTSASDVSFDPRVLNDVVQFIRVFTGQDSISGGPGGSSPAFDGNISSKLDHLSAKHSSPRAQPSSLLSKYAYDTDGTGSLSTDEQTFASEGDFVEDLLDGELPFMQVMGEIEYTFCRLLFPAARA